MEQLVARRAHNPEAVGSNPAPATKDNEKPFEISTFQRVFLYTKRWLHFCSHPNIFWFCKKCWGGGYLNIFQSPFLFKK